jgi:hypothetical protein
MPSEILNVWIHLAYQEMYTQKNCVLLVITAENWHNNQDQSDCYWII